MAGLEVVVRPVIFPDIRPPPAQPLPAPVNPDEGFAVIHGQGAKQINLPNSYSKSASSSVRSEKKRRVDKVRVYQKDDSGAVNKENFIDLEVLTKVWMKQGGAEEIVDFYRKPEEADNLEIKSRDVIKED